MKLLIIVITISLFCFSAVAKENVDGLTCSKFGTTVVWVNGINTPEDDAQKSMIFLKDSIEATHIDLKDLKFQLRYNQTVNVVDDIKESVAQKVSLYFNIQIEKAFIGTYLLSAFRSLSASDIASILPDWQSSEMQSIDDYIDNIEPSEFQNMVAGNLQQWEHLEFDAHNLKQDIAEVLLSGRKLILASHSQGNLFVAKAIQDYLDDGLMSAGGWIGQFSNYTKFISHLSIATPTDSYIEKKMIVLNDKDIINIVLPGSPSWNFDLEHNLSDPRGMVERFIMNHGFLETYMNSLDQFSTNPHSLTFLKEFTLQSFRDSAELLESNCPVAKFSHEVGTSNPLNVVFDATTSTNYEHLKFKWDFGDGSAPVSTEDKTIEHTFPSAGSFLVNLKITDSTGTIYGDLYQIQGSVHLTGPVTGCDLVMNPVPGRTHINPDGSLGGFVSFDSNVSGNVFISSNSSVCGGSSVEGNVRIDRASTVMDSHVKGTLVAPLAVGVRIDLSSMIVNSDIDVSASSFSGTTLEDSTANGFGLGVTYAVVKQSNVLNSSTASAISLFGTQSNPTKVTNSTVHNQSTVNMGGIIVNNSHVNNSTLTLTDIGSGTPPPGFTGGLAIMNSTINASVTGHGIKIAFKTINSPITGNFLDL